MKSRLTLVPLAAILILTVPRISHAQLKGFAFLRSIVGARAAGMGGAFTAISHDLHAIATNPAALASISRRQGAFDYLNDVLDVQSVFGAYLHPMGHGNVAVSLFYRDYGDFERLDEVGNSQGSFGASSFVLSAAYARQFSRDIWLGGSVKYLRSAIDTYAADGLAIDVGLFWDSKILENLKFGASVVNVGQSLSAYIQTKEDLPTRAEIGVSKQLAHLPLRWSVTGRKYFDEEFEFAAGGEFSLSENVFLRLGYNSLGSDQKLGSSNDQFAGVSAGVGIIYEKYHLDYAYSSQGGIGGLNRLSVTIQF